MVHQYILTQPGYPLHISAMVSIYDGSLPKLTR